MKSDHFYVNLFHLFVVFPGLAYLAVVQGKVPAPVWYAILALVAVGATYHTTRALQH